MSQKDKIKMLKTYFVYLFLIYKKIYRVYTFPSKGIPILNTYLQFNSTLNFKIK